MPTLHRVLFNEFLFYVSDFYFKFESNNCPKKVKRVALLLHLTYDLLMDYFGVILSFAFAIF